MPPPSPPLSPAGAGVADVTVITSAGASATTPADRFTYVAPTTTVVLSKALRLPHATDVAGSDVQRRSRPDAR